MRKKILLMMFALVGIAVGAMAQEFEYTYKGQTLKYYITDYAKGECRVQSANGATGEVAIPASAFNGQYYYTVTAMAWDSFKNAQITGLSIEDSEKSIDLTNSRLDTCPIKTLYIGRNFTYKSYSDSYYDEYTYYAPFAGNKSLNTLTFGNLVTSIHGFSGCTGLTSIDIPNSVTSINGFSGCTGLTSIDIPNSVTEIGHSAFSGCTGLTSIDIPNSVTSINGFSVCTGLTSINIPNSVTEIGGVAFSGCTGLTSIEISNSVTEIGYQAFEYCTGLTSIEIPNSVTEIGNRAFYGCSGLTSVEISNSVISIGANAFYGCSSLTSVEIPNSVTEIDWSAFASCSLLTNVTFEDFEYDEESREITFPDWESTNHSDNSTPEKVYTFSVTAGGVLTFNYSVDSESGYDKLIVWINDSQVLTESGNKSGTFRKEFTEASNVTLTLQYTKDGSQSSGNDYASVENICVNGHNNGSIYLQADLFANTPLETLYLGRNIVFKNMYYNSNFWGSQLKSITIGNSVTKIGDYAFRYCSELTSVLISNSVTEIGSHAFYDCTGLTSVEIPNSVTEIGEYAFYECTSLTSIELPNSVTKIGHGAFYGCSGLTSVEISNSVTEIGESAFAHCTSLTSIEIPNSVTKIDSYAFSGCTGLTSVVIPNSVTEIGSHAFYDCSSLSSIAIPNSVTEIDSYAFSGCTGLKSVIIEDGDAPLPLGRGQYYSTKKYGEYSAFKGCEIEELYQGRDIEDPYYDARSCGWGDKLKKVTIGDKVSIIAMDAFSGCSELETVEMGKSVATIGNRAFKGCSALTGIELPNTVTYIGVSAFDGCENMTTCNIPPYVNSIGERAFLCCQNWVADITIPEGIKKIGECTFSGCNALTSVSIPNSVTEIGVQAFTPCSGLKKAEFTSIEHLCNINMTYGSNPLECAHNLYINGEEIKEVVIPNSITKICDFAFAGASGLTSVEIPNSVTEIGIGAFSACSGLTSVEIPNSVTKIEHWAFNNCTGLKQLTFEDSEKPLINGATFNESPLEYLYLGRQIESNYSLFNEIETLNEVVIGKNIKSLESDMFAAAKGLKAVRVDAVLPPTAVRGSFADEAYLRATLYVPENSMKVYERTEPWSLFFNIEGFTDDNPPVGLEELDADGEPMDVYDLRGNLVGHDTEGLPGGVYIVRQGRKTTKIAI